MGLVFDLMSGTKRSVKTGAKTAFTGTGLLVSIIYGLLIFIIVVTNVFSLVIAIVIFFLVAVWAFTEAFIGLSYRAGKWFAESVVIEGVSGLQKAGADTLDFADKKLDSGIKFASGIVDASTDIVKQEFKEGKQRGVSVFKKIKLYTKLPVWRYKIGGIILNTILEARKSDNEQGMVLVDKMFDDLAEIRQYIIGELAKYE